MHFTEIIRSYLGWCPGRCVAPFRKEIIAWPDMDSRTLPQKGAYIREGIIIDYGKTGISLQYFIGALIGIIGITAFLLLIVRVGSLRLAAIPFCSLILLVAIFTVYQDLKRANLEINQDALVIRRSLCRPISIPKNTITAVEVRPNMPPIPLWLQKVLVLFVIPVSSAVTLYSEYFQFTAGEITSLSFFPGLGFLISIVLFFLASYHHSRIRAGYPEILVITTNSQKLAGVYGDETGEIAKLLGKPA